MLGGLWPVAHVDPRLWDRIVATNLTASYRLIRSLEPLLRKSEAGRAIFLTSGAAARPRAFWGAYATTKAGMEAMVRAWADEIEHTSVRAVLAEPRRDAHPHAGRGLPGRGPRHPARPGRDRAYDRGDRGPGRPRPADRDPLFFELEGRPRGDLGGCDLAAFDLGDFGLNGARPALPALPLG